MADIDVLFEPFRLKSLTLPNRVVMAPMTRQKSPNQVPGENVAAYYRRRTEGGVGLILTEGTSPEHHAASNSAEVPAFFGDAALAGWARVLKAVKSAGGHIMPQLWHQGLLRHAGTGPYPDAPSMSSLRSRQAGKKGRRTDDPTRHRRCDRGICKKRRLRKSSRLRRRRASRCARLCHRSVFLGRHQRARRQIWRFAGKARQVCRGDRRGRTPGSSGPISPSCCASRNGSSRISP